MPSFIPRQRKHKVRRRNHHGENPNGVDSNAAEILPGNKTEKEEKKQAMKAHFRAQQSKMTSRKQKRLDKYIVNEYLSDNYDLPCR